MQVHLLDLIEQQDGVLSRAQALCHLSAPVVRRRLTSGRWQAPHRGVYVTHSGPLGRRELRWIAVLGTLAGHVALLGGLSALEPLGFRGFEIDEMHVLLPAPLTAKRPPKTVVVHRTTLLPRSDVHRGSGPPRTAPARSLVDAAQWQRSERRAQTIIASGLQQRLARVDDVRSVVAAMPRLRHRALISEAIAFCAEGAQSLPEAEFIRLCRNAGLPSPQMQHPRPDPAGRRRYLDAYFPEQRLHVEIDGGHHMEVRHWWADMRRQNSLWIPGERVLRFPAWAIRHRPEEVLAQLKAALADRPLTNFRN